jgi:hypothetical protein
MLILLTLLTLLTLRLTLQSGKGLEFHARPIGTIQSNGQRNHNYLLARVHALEI